MATEKCNKCGRAQVINDKCEYCHFAARAAQVVLKAKPVVFKFRFVLDTRGGRL
jgi:hypothetical protein